MAAAAENPDQLITSSDPEHPANLIPSLCAKFWTLGWVTGTGGGCSIRDDNLVYIAPSGVQKELMKPADIYCTPLFLAAFTRRGAGCCIHTHSHWAVLVTLLLEAKGSSVFEINNIEQIKGFGKGMGKVGNLGYHDTLRIPVIENTPHEEDLTEYLEAAMEEYPDTYAVLVRRHGVYVWGDNVHKAKTQCESLDYLFQLAVEMHQLGLPWISNIAQIAPQRS
ncbi:Methylthioribulose-1-phosphate dehydratase [Trichoderma virens FT-333]|nr:Methylthioribulose-1-phosphate dehydratase [Trichoderma virens FT-333]